MDNKPTPPGHSIKLELGEKEAEGVYANLAVITHSPSEFVIDFARLLPGTPKSRVQTRVIMAPRNLKRLLDVLTDNIKRYEDRYGEIPTDVDPNAPPNKDIGFSTR